MRIKFEKGMTPEAIGRVFADYVRENNLVIGSVNMYIQTYDEDMKPEPFKKKEKNYLLCSPSEATKAEYDRDVVNIRRNRMKAGV